MRRRFEKIIISTGIIFVLGLCGCGKKEDTVQAVDPENMKILHDYFVYNGNGFYVDGLEWSDSWEDVREARGIEDTNILQEFTINDTMKGYTVQSDLWDEIPGCAAEENYSFSEEGQLSDIEVKVSISSEEAARTLLSEILPWVQNNLPEPFYSSELLEQDADAIIETLLKQSTPMTWNAEDGSQFNFETTGFDSTGYMSTSFLVRTPEFSSSTVMRSIADGARFR